VTLVAAGRYYVQLSFPPSLDGKRLPWPVKHIQYLVDVFLDCFSRIVGFQCWHIHRPLNICPHQGEMKIAYWVGGLIGPPPVSVRNWANDHRYGQTHRQRTRQAGVRHPKLWAGCCSRLIRLIHRRSRGLAKGMRQAETKEQRLPEGRRSSSVGACRWTWSKRDRPSYRDCITPV